jgi:hypothetical protein
MIPTALPRKRKCPGNRKEISRKKPRTRWEGFGQRIALQALEIRGKRRLAGNTEEWRRLRREARAGPRSGSGAVPGWKN